MNYLFCAALHLCTRSSKAITVSNMACFSCPHSTGNSQQYIRGYLQKPRCSHLIIIQHVVETITSQLFDKTFFLNPYSTECLTSYICVCFQRCEEQTLKDQTGEKEKKQNKTESLFILLHSIQKLNFLAGFAKCSFGNCFQNSTNHNGGKDDCSPLSKTIQGAN